jgi:hypothetical protein
MLPDFASIALQEESSKVFGIICCCDEFRFCGGLDALFEVFFGNLRWAWIVIEATNAADCFVVVGTSLPCAVRHVFNGWLNEFLFYV